MNFKATEFIKTCRIPGAHPKILNTANTVMSKTNAPQAQINQLLTSDPVIALHILKNANSSLNRGNKVIGKISQAMTSLGLKQIRVLVKSISSIDSFHEDINEFLTIDDFWRRSIAVGTAARIIDRLLGGNSDEIFTAGLLHDFGRLTMLLNSDKIPIIDLLRTCHTSGEMIYKHERKEIGFNHMEVADALFGEWNIPPSIRESAAFHHSPVLAIRYRYETSIVHIADVICSAMEIGKNGEGCIPIYDDNARRLLNLGVDQLDYICEETSHQVEERLKVLDS